MTSPPSSPSSRARGSGFLIIPLISAVVFTAALDAQSAPDRAAAQSWLQKGIDAENHGRMDEARHAFEQAIGADPSLIDARENLASLLILRLAPGKLNDPANRERVKTAEDELKEVLKLNSGHERALEQLAGLERRQAREAVQEDVLRSRCDEAANLYRRLIAADPKGKTHYTDLASTYLSCALSESKWDRAAAASRIESARATLAQVLTLDPDFSYAMMLNAVALRDRAAVIDDARQAAADERAAEEWDQKVQARKSAPGAAYPRR